MTARAKRSRTRRLVVAYVAAWVTLITLALYARAYQYFAWDLRWEIAWQAETWPGREAVMEALTWLGDGWHPYLVLAVVAGALALKGATKEAQALVACVAGGELFALAVKFLVHRPRPSAVGIHVMRQRPTPSFPSGHVVNYMFLYGFLFALTLLHVRRGPKRAAVLVVLGALLIGIGLSRVYVGEHWPSDVIGGYLVGLCWLGMAVPVYRRWRSPEPPAEGRPVGDNWWGASV